MNSNLTKKIFSFCAINLIVGTHVVHASVQTCRNAPLIVTGKVVGSVTYFAEDCKKNWENQNIRLDFSYRQNIPEWAFKRAATHFLKKNIADFSDNSPLNNITELYHPVKKGDLYSLSYNQNSNTLTLSLVLFLITKLIPNSSAFMKVVLVTELIFLIRGSHKDYFKPST